MGGWMVIYKENEELQNIMPNFKSHGGGGSRERSYFTTRVQFIIHFAIIKNMGKGWEQKSDMYSLLCACACIE